MKKLTLGFLLIPWLGMADVLPPPAASQVEVNAGVVATKYVSPKTLAGWTGTTNISLTLSNGLYVSPKTNLFPVPVSLVYTVTNPLGYASPSYGAVLTSVNTNDNLFVPTMILAQDIQASSTKVCAVNATPTNFTLSVTSVGTNTFNVPGLTGTYHWTNFSLTFWAMPTNPFVGGSGGSSAHALTADYATSAGTLAFPVGPYGGYAMLLHNGTNVSYPTLAGALSNAVAYDTISLHGILSEPSNCPCPVGLTLVFNGATLTNAAPGTGGSALGISDNTRFLGPGNVVLNANYATVWFGFSGTDPIFQKGATNWVIDGLSLSGYSDTLYLWATNYFHGTVRNCTLEGWGYDVMNEGQPNAPTAGVPWSGVDFVNDVFTIGSAYYQNARGMLFENVSNTWTECLIVADDRAHTMAWMTGANTATNEFQSFNNVVFRAYGTNGGNMLSLHKNSRYVMNNVSMTTEATNAIPLNLDSSVTGASNVMANVNFFGMYSPITIGNTASYVYATGGNVTSANVATHPENFFANPMLLAGDGSGLTNISPKALSVGATFNNVDIPTNALGTHGFSGYFTNGVFVATGTY